MSTPDAPVDPAVLRDLSHSPDQRFWLLREMQEALERAALRAPVLISLDDVQWADPATLAALGSLTRQLAAHRILWLLAVRSGEPGAAERTALSRLAAAGTVRSRSARWTRPRWPASPPTCSARRRTRPC